MQAVWTTRSATAGPGLAWIPGTPGSPERLLITAVVAGFPIQVGHQAVLMLHTCRYSPPGT